MTREREEPRFLFREGLPSFRVSSIPRLSEIRPIFLEEGEEGSWKKLVCGQWI